ncbi:MAG: MFS transporter [Pseudomonadota bacterium]
MSKAAPSLFATIASVWALLLGFGILMLGDGLQGTLLAVRADREGFSATLTGIIMSSFYVGFLCGSITTPKIMMLVGHVRVFAALAALASAAILVHAVFVTVSMWIVLRLISGFCFAGLYVVAESWLNDRATNRNRGKLLSLYMVVTYLGVGIGQLFLNLADPQDYPLFVLTSVLISIAVVPLLLSASSSPNYSDSVSISVRELYTSSPLGIVGLFIVGLVTATFFALGPVYSQRLGMSLRDISWFMAAAVVGTVIMQWPIGALSDRFDRRLVLTVATILSAIAAFACIVAATLSVNHLFLSVAVFAGLALPLYSICIAYINDNLSNNQMIAASGTLVLIGGVGAVAGPTLVAAVMDAFGNDGFFWCMGGAHLLTGLFAIYRMLRGQRRTGVSKGSVVPAGVHPASAIYEGIQRHAQETSTDEASDQ